ncbi:hypothetical protein AMS68_003850 [Peltaster fructicola]|uniref:Cytochrome P450 n=1 Tax=Peltaster fructicola TaxID=286661 RepID=A0A6H0XUC9_9PEZI|nr:hypothetical protein AMS68_003850 [Peltaster fructicola]
MPSTKALTFPFAREESFEPPTENARLRHACPITKVKLFDNTEAWLLTRRKDCCTILASEDVSADRRHPGYPEIHEGGAKAKEKRPTFVNLDNPAHKDQRALLDPYFTKKATDKLRPMIQTVVDSMLDKMVKEHGEHTNKPVEFIHSFAGPIPPQVIYHLLGIPEKDIPVLSQDSEVRTSTSRNAAETSNSNLQEYMRKYVQMRMQNPQQDLVSHLVQGPLQQGELELEDVVELAFLVLVAGNAALINSIALGVITLLEHPDQLDEFKTDPSLAPQVVSELLRYNTTSALNSRRAVKHEIEVGGQQLKPDERVICAVQSADRDEEHFDNPDSFNIHRTVRSEDILGFGWGIHRCQGEWLSRAELEIVFATLFRRLPNLRLAEDKNKLKWTPPTQNIGVMEMPVLW